MQQNTKLLDIVNRRNKQFEQMKMHVAFLERQVNLLRNKCHDLEVWEEKCKSDQETVRIYFCTLVLRM